MTESTLDNVKKLNTAIKYGKNVGSFRFFMKKDLLSLQSPEVAQNSSNTIKGGVQRWEYHSGIQPALGKEWNTI